MSVHRLLTGTNLHEPFNFVQETDPGAVGANLYWLKVSTGALKRRNAGNSAWVSVGGGASVFTQLTDAPASYAGQALKSVRVNAGATALEFADGTIPNWLQLSADAPPTSPNALDDEFLDSATLPGGGSAIWTWRNQDANGSVSLTKSKAILTANAIAADDVKIIEQNCPANPWEFTARICAEYAIAPANAVMGIVALETGTGKLVVFGHQQVTGGLIARANYTTVDGGVAVGTFAAVARQPIYIRFADNGTNFVYSYSLDGASFQTVLSESRTTHLTGSANKIGLAVASENGTSASIMSCDWFRRTV